MRHLYFSIFLVFKVLALLYEQLYVLLLCQHSVLPELGEGLEELDEHDEVVALSAQKLQDELHEKLASLDRHREVEDRVLVLLVLVLQLEDFAQQTEQVHAPVQQDRLLVRARRGFLLGDFVVSLAAGHLAPEQF